VTVRAERAQRALVPQRPLVPASGFRVSGSGFRVSGSGFRVLGPGSGFQVSSFGFRVQVEVKVGKWLWLREGYGWEIVMVGRGYRGTSLIRKRPPP